MILRVIFILLVLAFNCHALDFGAPEGKNVAVVFRPERSAIAYVNAVDLSGYQSAVDVGFRATHQMCTVTTGGTAPTSVIITAQRSTDAGTNYATMFTHTYTVATPTTQAFDIAYPGRYWRMSYDNRTGGDATTTVTVKCDAKE